MGQGSIPSSVYSGYIELIEFTHWTMREIEGAPADLIDEMLVCLSERNKAQRREQKQAERKGSRGTPRRT